VRYGSKPLEFTKGKNAIELGSEAEVTDVLAKVREAAELGEFDALILLKETEVFLFWLSL